MNEKIKTLYTGKEKTEEIFPRTKVEAINDENGIDLNTILENKANKDNVAPSGYGLGTTCSEIDDWNNATQNGFWASSVNSPEDGTMWWGFTIARGKKYIEQIAFRSADENPIRHRSMYNGEWQGWEILLDQQFKITKDWVIEQIQSAIDLTWEGKY